MRSLLVALLALAPACVPGPDAAPAPRLQVTAPQRSLIQPQAGPLVVTGTVTPSPGVAIAKVMVNDVAATVDGSGNFQATIDVPPGASLVHTVATDADGGLATDTRSVEAGPLLAPGSNIPEALGVAISAPAFAQIGDLVAGQLTSAMLTQLAKTMNPVVHAGDENGPDCLYGQAYVDNLAITGAKLSLVPTTGGLAVSAEIDGLDITGHASFAVACAKGSSSFEVTASSATLGATLQLAMAGTSGFSGQIANAAVTLSPDARIMASGIPQQVLDILPLAKIVDTVAPAAIPLLANPLIDKALGALTAPQQLSLFGETIDLQVAPSAIAFDPSGGTVMLDMKLLIEGTEHSAGFTSTPSGMPALDPGNGLSLALAENLANEALAELTATGLLNLSIPTASGSAQLAATSPPMISDAGGKLRLILPDMMMTVPGGKAALNAQVDLAITPGPTPSSIAIELGTPAIAIDTLGEASPSDFTQTAHDGTGTQLGSITQLLGDIPLPQVDGVQLTNTSVTGSNGYILVNTTLQ